MHTKHLFDGTAEYYAKYRLDYPNEILNLIRTQYKLNGKGKLLDLGCGTGQLAIPFHQDFDLVLAVDINSEMLEEGKRQCIKQQIDNIEWVQMAAEELDEKMGTFDLIVCGNAFHWMDRAKVLDICYRILNNKGGMVVLAGSSVWSKKTPWQQKVVEVIQKFLGNERKAGSGIYPKNLKRHEDYIHASPFRLIKSGHYITSHDWDLEHLLGNLYSTSFCNRKLLGEHVKAFEEELQSELLKLHPDGIFTEPIEITYFFLEKNLMK